MQNDKIKVGAVLVAIDDVPQLLTKGKGYPIYSVLEDKFMIINDYGHTHIVYFCDLVVHFKFKEEPAEDEIKVGDEYVGKTTGGTYTVKEIREDAYRCWNGSEHICYTRQEMNDFFTKKPKPLAKESIEEVQGFYMVVVSGSIYPPTEQHNDFDYALGEATRLSKKENKTAYVLKSVTQVEQVSKITNLKK
jgi:hypothetical protein